MKKILLLNASPRAGKDTMAEWFETQGWYHAKFSRVLKERTHELYGLKNLPYDYFENLKDTPISEFYGKTPRQAYINLSEMLMKPAHGDDIWVQMFAREIKNIDNDYIVVSDLGFQVEWETLIKMFGYDKLAVCMIYRDGCTFENDSRNYIAPRGPWEYIEQPDADYNKYIMTNCYDVENGGSLDDLYIQCKAIHYNIVNDIQQPITGQGVPIGAMNNKKVSG